MRGNILTVLAGAVAAFFYVAIFLPLGFGHILWPFAAVPLYIVALNRDAADNLLALAGAGAFISLMSVSGVLMPGGGVKTLASFLLVLAMPAILGGLFYRTLTRNGHKPRGEPVIAFYVFMALGVFFITAAAFSVAGNPMHQVFYQTALPLAEALTEHLQSMNRPLTGLTPEAIARDIARQMAAFVPVMFIIMHGVCLLAARWLLESRQKAPPPAPRLSPLNFPMKISFLFFATLAVYTFMVQTEPENTLIFYIGPLLAGLALPLAAQGAATVYENIIKRLAKGVRYGIYIVLMFTILLAPVFTCFIFVMVGMGNQLFASNKTEI